MLTPPITILLAEDHLIVREGLRALLKLERDLRVVGEAGNGREAVKLARTLCPDVIVMDIAMPLLNGLEATRQILQAQPTARVIILSAHSDDAYLESVLALGAAGYLIKQSAAHILPQAIRQVHQGQQYFSPRIARRLQQRKLSSPASGLQQRKLSPASGPKLTAREMEVLQLIAEGHANKQTADHLHISIKTVEKHRQSLMAKLDIHDTASLTRYAIATGIIESSVQITII